MQGGRELAPCLAADLQLVTTAKVAAVDGSAAWGLRWRPCIEIIIKADSAKANMARRGGVGDDSS